MRSRGSALRAAFVHPLTPPEWNEFIPGLGLLVNLSKSFGMRCSGGVLIFKGGERLAFQRKLRRFTDKY